ncbi:hypothetical protein [Bacteroides finegoldii]|uniref:hypothetical protein n=1 Tax=Bacteroides finegoldii TaxID=338188 RepID=UPI00189C7DC7|nr:hypothetical protein [Bacteroides finegoldii]
MKLKTATLLAAIGMGIASLQQLYYFIRFNIMDRSDYRTIEGDINSILTLFFYVSLFIFFIVFYQKQNSKSWKD